MEAMMPMHDDHEDDTDLVLPRLGETLVELLITVVGFIGAILLIFALLHARPATAPRSACYDHVLSLCQRLRAATAGLRSAGPVTAAR